MRGQVYCCVKNSNQYMTMDLKLLSSVSFCLVYDNSSELEQESRHIINMHWGCSRMCSYTEAFCMTNACVKCHMDKTTCHVMTCSHVSKCTKGALYMWWSVVVMWSTVLLLSLSGGDVLNVIYHIVMWYRWGDEVIMSPEEVKWNDLLLGELRGM